MVSAGCVRGGGEHSARKFSHPGAFSRRPRTHLGRSARSERGRFALAGLLNAPRAYGVAGCGAAGGPAGRVAEPTRTAIPVQKYIFLARSGYVPPGVAMSAWWVGSPVMSV